MIDHEELSLIGTAAKPGLVDMLRSGELVVPEFQRTFLWATRPERTTSLLASIAQEWPAGALLLMAGDRGFHVRQVDGWKKEKSDKTTHASKYALLDGQQRMTAIYQAYLDRSPDYVFVIAIEKLLNDGIIDPEEEGTFRSFGRKTWDKRFGSVEKQRTAGLIPVSSVLNVKAWEFWKDDFDSNEKAEFSALRDEGPLSGLIRYQFPVSIVLESAPDEALANIFVTINQQGIKLTTFDLVVARTVKRARGADKGFNLRDIWEEAAGREETEEQPVIPPKFERVRNFGIPPEVPLKLVRLMVDPAAKLSDTSILKLSPAEVQQKITQAIGSLETVLRFLEERIGLIPQTLADPNYLLPIAVIAERKPAVLRNKGDSADILRWYWSATFRMIFGRGQTGDLIPRETGTLLDWILLRGDEPATVADFWRVFDQELKGRFFQGLAQNQQFMRSLFALECSEGAVDWKGLPDGAGGFERFELRDAGAWPIVPLDIHHIWARGVKKPARAKKKIDGLDTPYGEFAFEAVINRCLLLKSTNQAVGNTPFPAVPVLEGIDIEHMSTYLLDPSQTDYHGFVTTRLEHVITALERRLPRPKES